VIPTIQKNTLEFIRLSRLYAARTGAHLALGAYSTLDSLLSALSGKGQADPETRRRLICAVIEEHQAAPGPLGAAIVLHAFRGMLVQLSRSLVGVDDPDDADGIVTAGLLEALRRVRPGRDPDRIGMYVRQETRRAVFAALRRDARARELLDVDEESGEGEEDGLDLGDDREPEEPPRDPLAAERAWRRRAPDAIADPESLAPLEDRLLFYRPSVDAIPDETLLRANAVRGGLRRLADHLFAEASPLERRRAYDQLVGRTRRLLATAK
jgi:hypothetical protein